MIKLEYKNSFLILILLFINNIYGREHLVGYGDNFFGQLGIKNHPKYEDYVRPFIVGSFSDIPLLSNDKDSILAIVNNVLFYSEIIRAESTISSPYRYRDFLTSQKPSDVANIHFNENFNGEHYLLTHNTKEYEIYKYPTTVGVNPELIKIATSIGITEPIYSFEMIELDSYAIAAQDGFYLVSDGETFGKFTMSPSALIKTMECDLSFCFFLSYDGDIYRYYSAMTAPYPSVVYSKTTQPNIKEMAYSLNNVLIYIDGSSRIVRECDRDFIECKDIRNPSSYTYLQSVSGKKCLINKIEEGSYEGVIIEEIGNLDCRYPNSIICNIHPAYDLLGNPIGDSRKTTLIGQFDISNIKCGVDINYAIANNGTLYAWGDFPPENNDDYFDDPIYLYSIDTGNESVVDVYSDEFTLLTLSNGTILACGYPEWIGCKDLYPNLEFEEIPLKAIYDKEFFLYIATESLLYICEFNRDFSYCDGYAHIVKDMGVMEKYDFSGKNELGASLLIIEEIPKLYFVSHRDFQSLSDTELIESIESSYTYTMALTTDKTLICYGVYDHSQCCDFSDVEDVTDYAAGYFHSMFITDKKLYACGKNLFDTISPGEIITGNEPYHVNHGPIEDKDICRVWIVYATTIVQTCDNEIYYWGRSPGKLFNDDDSLNLLNHIDKRSNRIKKLDEGVPPLIFSSMLNIFGTKNTITYNVDYDTTIDCRGRDKCNIGGYRDNITHIFIDRAIRVTGKLKLSGVEVIIKNPHEYIPITVGNDEYSEGEISISDGTLTIEVDDDDILDKIIKNGEIVIVVHENNKDMDIEFTTINFDSKVDECIKVGAAEKKEIDLSLTLSIKVEKCKKGLQPWLIAVIVVACVVVIVGAFVIVSIKSKSFRRRFLPFSKSVRR